MRVCFIAILTIILSCSMHVVCMEYSDVWLKIISYSNTRSKNALAKSCKGLKKLSSKNNLELYLQSPLNLTKSQKEYALIYCAYKNYLPGVENLLQHGVDAYYTRWGIITCPVCIAKYHNNDCMKDLVKQYKTCRCAKSIQPYALAAHMGDTDVLREYVQSEDYNPIYENVASSFQGSTLLYAAILNGHRDVIPLLLTNPKTIQYINSGCKGDGRAIDVAFEKGHADIVEQLFAIPSLRMRGNKYCGKKLYYLSRRGHSDCVRLLLKRKPSCINALIVECLTNINGVTSNKLSITSLLNASSLAIAALNGHRAIVELLLGCQEIAVNIPPYDRESAEISYDLTPLYAATLNGHTEIVTSLLQHPDINPFLYTNNYTVLHIACKKGYTGIVKLLVRHSPQLLAERTKDTKESPYQLAYQYRHYDVVKFLMTKLHLIKKFASYSEETEYY